MEEPAGPITETRRHVTRRDFLKWGAGAGVAATLAGMGVLSAAGIVKEAKAPPPPWEYQTTDPASGLTYTRVDYSKVPPGLSGPTPNVLKVAQWYDYWPGSFVTDFIAYMKSQFNLTIDVQVDIYTSNEELFEWITLGRASYDVFFPSNYVVDLMKHGNLVYNLNLDWIPNFSNLDPNFYSVPASNPFDRNPWGEYVSVPYFWGTTGVGYRSDMIPAADVAAQGIDFLWMQQWTPSDPSLPTVQLTKKMRMLDDERDALGWGFKKAGWEEQIAKGLTPTGVPSYTGGYQWTTNETDIQRVNACGSQLFAARPNLFDYNSTEDASSLVGGAAYVNQAWSGDIMYAKRPDQNVSLPIDYQIPIQGSTWWIDCCAVHSKSRNLWLAHQFFNFIQNVADPWPENQILTKWNLYSTPNAACYDILLANPFPNGWNMAEEPVLYPNIYDKPGFARCDMSGDVGLNALLNEYNPLWFDLTSV